VAEQNTTKGASPTGVLRSLAAYWRRTVTVLLYAVRPYTIFYSLLFIDPFESIPQKNSAFYQNE
jgi:hypothetical protein